MVNGFIFSVYMDQESTEGNIKSHKSVLKFLQENNIIYKELEGNYEGQKEQSLFIPFFLNGDISNQNSQVVMNFCQLFHQECLLYIDNYSTAFMINVDQSTRYNHVPLNEGKDIGSMVVYAELPKGRTTNYTYDPEYGKYFITKRI